MSYEYDIMFDNTTSYSYHRTRRSAVKRKVKKLAGFPGYGVLGEEEVKCKERVPQRRNEERGTSRAFCGGRDVVKAPVKTGEVY